MAFLSTLSDSRNFLHALRRFFQSAPGITVLLAVAWQLAFTIIGISISPDASTLAHMTHWDAGWYLHIIATGYAESGSPAAPAFYPLFPLLVSAIHTLSFGLFSVELSALILNTFALWMALLALIHILRFHGVSRSGKVLALSAFLCFPSAFFMHAFYGEALFVAIAFWAYAFALQRKWWAMALLLAILTASRLPSLLFVGLCSLEYLKSYQWNLQKAFNKQAGWFVLAPLGFIFYGLYLQLVRGDFLAMFHAYGATDDWLYQKFNPNILGTLYQSCQQVFASIIGGSFNYEIFINYALPLASLFAIALSSVYVWYRLKKEGIPLLVFGLVSIVFYTLNSNVVSVHRYALACIVIYVAVALFAKHQLNKVLLALLCLASLAVQFFLYTKFVQSIFAG